MYGNSVRVKVVKNKVAPPFRKAEFEILFGSGINKLAEIADLGVATEIIKKSGAFFSYEGNRLAHGRDNLLKLLADNPELAEELEEKLMAKLTGNALKTYHLWHLCVGMHIVEAIHHADGGARAT